MTLLDLAPLAMKALHALFITLALGTPAMAIALVAEAIYYRSATTEEETKS